LATAIIKRYYKCRVCLKLHALKDDEKASCGHSNLQQIPVAMYHELKFGNPYGDSSDKPL
jgi:hypothetical protein